MNAEVQWTAPTPLWPAYATAPEARMDAGSRRFIRPHILRFTSDDFMAEFLAVLENEPHRLGEWQAQAEVWHSPWQTPAAPKDAPAFVRRLERLRLATATAAGVAPAAVLPPEPDSGRRAALPGLKLYQPGHMRYYLVTASLVCRVPGLPDRALDAAAGESAGFVVRRLRPKDPGKIPSEYDLTTCDEYAYLPGQGWQRASHRELADGEEVNPLFAASYVEADGRRRRIHAGTIPVARREQYITAAPVAQPATVDEERLAAEEAQKQRLKAHFKKMVGDPWRRMADHANRTFARLNVGDDRTAARQAAEQAMWSSLLILADFRTFLAKHLPNVLRVIDGGATAATLTQAEAALHRRLAETTYTDPAPGSVPVSLADALKRIAGCIGALDSAENNPDPTEILAKQSPCPGLRFGLHAPGAFRLAQNPRNVTGPVIDDYIYAALSPAPRFDTPPLPVAAEIAQRVEASEPAWFIIRCVFDQPDCGPLSAPLLSQPTAAFQMAAYFDPDAPARPLKINLPVDISPAGLRKFDKNTAFLVSDALCSQMNRLGALSFGDLVRSVLPPPLGGPLPAPSGGECKSGTESFGLVCSLSIPIITICALILLMIIVSLLDIIFRWLPFFIMCFPLPRFKAKES